MLATLASSPLTLLLAVALVAPAARADDGDHPPPGMASWLDQQVRLAEAEARGDWTGTARLATEAEALVEAMGPTESWRRAVLTERAAEAEAWAALPAKDRKAVRQSGNHLNGVRRVLSEGTHDEGVERARNRLGKARDTLPAAVPPGHDARQALELWSLVLDSLPHMPPWSQAALSFTTDTRRDVDFSLQTCALLDGWPHGASNPTADLVDEALSLETPPTDPVLRSLEIVLRTAGAHQSGDYVRAGELVGGMPQALSRELGPDPARVLERFFALRRPRNPIVQKAFDDTLGRDGALEPVQRLRLHQLLEAFGGEGPAVARAWGNVGATALRKGRTVDAHDALLEAVRAWRRCRPDGNPHLALDTWQLALALHLLGDTERAAAGFRFAADAYAAATSPFGPALVLDDLPPDIARSALEDLDGATRPRTDPAFEAWCRDLVPRGDYVALAPLRSLVIPPPPDLEQLPFEARNELIALLSSETNTLADNFGVSTDQPGWQRELTAKMQDEANKALAQALADPNSDITDFLGKFDQTPRPPGEREAKNAARAAAKQLRPRLEALVAATEQAVSLAEFGRALALLDEAATLSASALEGQDPGAGRTDACAILTRRGWVRYLRGDLSGAEADFRQVLDAIPIAAPSLSALISGALDRTEVRNLTRLRYALVLDRSGRLDEATALRQALRDEPTLREDIDRQSRERSEALKAAGFGSMSALMKRSVERSDAGRLHKHLDGAEAALSVAHLATAASEVRSGHELLEGLSRRKRDDMAVLAAEGRLLLVESDLHLASGRHAEAVAGFARVVAHARRPELDLQAQMRAQLQEGGGFEGLQGLQEALAGLSGVAAPSFTPPTGARPMELVERYSRTTTELVDAMSWGGMMPTDITRQARHLEFTAQRRLAALHLDRGELGPAVDAVAAARTLSRENPELDTLDLDLVFARLLIRQDRAEDALALAVDALHRFERQAAELGDDLAQRATWRSRQLASNDPYRVAFEAALAQAATTPSRRPELLAQALDLVERSRGRAFLELFDRGRGDARATVLARIAASGDEELLDELRPVLARLDELDAEVAQVEERLAAASEHGRDTGPLVERRAAFLEQRAAATADYDALVRPYRNVAAEAPLGWEALRPRLAPGESLWIYQVGPETSWLLVASRDGSVASHELTWPDGSPVRDDELTSVVFRFLASMGRGLGLRAEAYDTRRSFTDLTAALVPDAVRPGLSSGRRVLLVPDGPLHHLAFDTLPLLADAGSASGDERWVHVWPALAYGPSATSLLRLRDPDRNKVPALLGAVVVGDPTFREAADGIRVSTGRSDLDELLGTFEPLQASGVEARAVDALIRRTTGADDLVLLTGDAATEEALDTSTRRPRFLHLATHGVSLAPPHAFDSCLALAGAGSGPGVGQLSLAELLDTWSGRLLGTELTVLSGCRTAVGRDERGEGSIALSWGFLHAGSESVIATRWNVGEAGSPLLVARFYANHLGHDRDPLPKAEALAEAKAWLSRLTRREVLEQRVALLGEPASLLDEIEDGDDYYDEIRFADPSAWGAFFLTGNPD